MPLRYKLLAALTLLVVAAAGFLALDLYLSAGSFHDVSTALDARVPFAPAWVWVYAAYYPFCFLPLACPGILTDDGVFKRAVAGFALQFALSFPVFWLYPTAAARPDPAGSGWSLEAVRLLYRVDPGFNVFPSLHVSNAVFVAFLAWRLRGRAWGAAALFGAALISASTVLVKQHYLADLPSGAALGALAFALAFRGLKAAGRASP